MMVCLPNACSSVVEVLFLTMNSNMFLFEGQMTGVCVNATKTCEVLTWCPVENDRNIPEYVKTQQLFIL